MTEWHSQHYRPGKHSASILALNLCAYLCIGRLGMLYNRLTFSSLREFCARFDSLHPLHYKSSTYESVQ
jgi:hypothetical protein